MHLSFMRRRAGEHGYAYDRQNTDNDLVTEKGNDLFEVEAPSMAHKITLGVPTKALSTSLVKCAFTITR